MEGVGVIIINHLFKSSSIMRCYWCGTDFPVPNAMWAWVWLEQYSLWEFCVFHQGCLVIWWYRVAAGGGA